MLDFEEANCDAFEPGSLQIPYLALLARVVAATKTAPTRLLTIRGALVVAQGRHGIEEPAMWHHAPFAFGSGTTSAGPVPPLIFIRLQ